MRWAILLSLFPALLLAGCGGGVSPPTPIVTAAAAPSVATVAERTPQYQNPVEVRTADGSLAESCPDPSIVQSPTDQAWYVFCTNERFSDNGPVHLIPVLRSTDLVHWAYMGDVFPSIPPWVAADGGLWAPDIRRFNNKYFLYYSASNTRQGGAAIFVATSDSPLGPWTAYPAPVVEPCCSTYNRAVIDPAIVEDNGQRYIFYGSFSGGISARALSADGLRSDAASEVQISPPDRYEGAYVIQRDGYFYLMVSAGRCCEGAFSGYGVFAGRSRNVLGPYLDREGNSLADARVGGTPVLAMNGNRWLGPGHNAVASDAAGQDWIVYHAVDAHKPKFNGSWTRRPLMVDRLDWKDGWPEVRGGAGASEAAVNSPATGAAAADAVQFMAREAMGSVMTALSDEFDGQQLSPRWTWLRPPAVGSFSVSNGALHIAGSAGEIYLGNHSAPLLTELAPSGNYAVEVKVSNNVPLAGSYNFAQSGIAIYEDDDNYVKLVVVAVNGTRQIEFAKQAGSATSPPQYGSSYLSAPADSTFLRIVRRSGSGGETYTAYSSQDGTTWERGATWTHSLGNSARIALLSMARGGFTSDFDYVRVYALAD